MNNFEEQAPERGEEKTNTARAADRGDDVVWQYMHAMGQIFTLYGSNADPIDYIPQPSGS